jgi:hypothetical protein
MWVKATTTHRMYIGATRVPLGKPTPISRIFLIPIHPHIILILIQHHHRHRAIMVKVQPHKKIVTQSDSRRQASTVAKQSVLPSRDPRTVCMTEGDLGVLQASFRANRWPERAEKERLAQLINKYVSPFSLFFRTFVNTWLISAKGLTRRSTIGSRIKGKRWRMWRRR